MISVLNNRTVSNPIENNLEVVRKYTLRTRIRLGINAASLVTTPIAITVAANHLDDDYAKKALYATGGLLWAYQLASTIDSYRKTRSIMKVYEFMKEANALMIEHEGKVLINKLSQELNEEVNHE